jgi:acyl-CoA thioesterase
VTPEQLARACADAMWAEDSASRALGMRLAAVGPGSAQLSMTVQPHMVNGHGMCHGGYIFTLADSSFAFA